MTPNTVLISGAGQLGSRYLQGLAACRLPLQIHVHDIHPDSLAVAQERWFEMATPATPHQVTFHHSLESIPLKLDIAVVATTARVRPQVVREIASYSSVRYWILEKVLAQSEAGLDEIVAQVGLEAKAWINTPRRMLPWHQQIKSKLNHNGPLSLEVDGGSWGLACNTVHYLDMFAWWTGETLEEVDTQQLDSRWVEAKRPGNWEIFGTLHARFSGGSHARLSVTSESFSYSFKLRDGIHSWSIDEEAGIAKRSDGLNIPGRLPYQSEVSAGLVESILEHGSCSLPTLQDSVAIHRVFIRSMLEHWKLTVDSNANCVPIT